MAVPSSLPPGLALSQAASTPAVAYVNLKAILETYVVSMSGFEEPAPLYLKTPECWGRAYMYMYMYVFMYMYLVSFSTHMHKKQVGVTATQT